MRTFTQKLAFLLVALLCYVGVQAQETITLTGSITQELTPGQSYLFYDSGGPTANYGSSQNYTAVLTNAGGSITINFSSLATESSSYCSDWDYMLIYDDETLIGRAQTGCATATITTDQDYVAESGTLKIEWHSDGSGFAAGWEATITAAGGGEVTCNTVETVEVTDVAASQATINWTGGDGSYSIEYKAAGADKWTSVEGISAAPYVLTGLTPNSAYSVKVYNVCGPEDVSYAKTANFTTAIGLPYLEPFSASSIPSGWSKQTGVLNDDGSAALSPASGSYHWTFGTASGVFDSHAYIEVYNSQNQWLVSPVIPMEDGYQLSFKLALTYWNGDNVPCSSRASQPDARFVVLCSNDGGSNWVVLREWNNTGSEYVFDDIVCSAEGQEEEIDLSNYANQNIQIGFYIYHSTGGDNKLHIDNVKIAPVPTCFKPTDLHEVEGHATKSSVQLDWTANTEESAWKLQYKKASDAEWNTVDVTSKPYTLSNLDAFTEYNVQVAAVCSESDQSEYSKAISVKTAAGVPFAQGFNTYSLSADWKRYAGVLENVLNGAELEAVSAGWNTGNKTNNVFPDSTYHLYLNIAGETTNHWIVSPIIEMEAGYQLSFDLALTAKAGTNPTAATAGQQKDDKFAVIIRDDEGWHTLRKWDNESTQDYDEINATANGQVIKIDLSDYAGKAIQIAFYGESTVAGGDNNLHISNFKIALPPACEPATQLNITGIGGTFATAVWDNIEDAVWQYSLVANPAADFVPAEDAFITLDDEGVYTLTLSDLSENTNYGFFLRRKCGEADFSDIISRSFKTIQTPVVLDSEHPFSDNFEAGNKWVLINGEQTNQWAYGTAVSNGGSHALYISNDAGESNAMTYDSYSNTSYVYATKTFSFIEPGVYTFSFDWRNNGGSSYYMRAYLAPLSAEPNAGSSTYNLSGLIPLHSASELYGQSDWQHESFEYRIEEAGTYKVILYWYNSYPYYSSTNYNPPAAVDNFAISRLACPKPQGLALAELGAETVKFEWESASDGSIEYAYALLADDMPENFTPVDENSVEITGLTEQTTYKFYLRKSCGETEKSEVISLNFTTKQLPVEVGNASSDDFESGNNWLFVNGTLTNQWVLGEAAHNGEGSHALYISKDNGASHSYTNNSSTMVYATKLFHFEGGNYIFKYDWIANGEAGWDFARVALAPASVELAAGTSLPSGLTKNTVPATWVALDGGSELSGSTAWASVVSNEIEIAEGDYMVIFAWRNDGSGGSDVPAAIDNFSITKVLCQTPLALSVVADSTTTSSVVLTWTPKGSEENWLVRYRKVGAEAWNTPIVVAHVDGNAADSLKIVVEPSSTYEAQVAALCDPSDPESASDYSASITFASGCDAISSLSENFDGITEIPSNANKLPVCWSFINTNTSSSHNYYPTILESATFAHSGSNSLYFHSSAYASSNGPENQYAVLPEMTSVSDKRIKFYARPFSSGSNDPCFAVGVMTDPADTSTFVPVYTRCGYLAEYAPFVIPLDSYTGEGKFIAIKLDVAAQGGDYTHGLYIDDVVVEDIPSCLEPSGLAAALTQGNGSVATLSWTAGADETAWVVEYSVNADFSDALSANASENPSLDLSGLTPETTYYARVKAVCGEGNESPWSDPVSFKPTNIFSLLINNGATTSGYVPITTSYMDEGAASQFIIPAADLASIQWATINELTFYNSLSSIDFGTAKYDVYMASVDNDAFSSSSYVAWASLTKVKNAATVTVSGNQMVITLDNPYLYEGGNLLIGFDQTLTNSSYISSSWQGVTASSAAIYDYGSYGPYSGNFRPKMLISYTPGEAPSCVKPTALAVALTEGDGSVASLSWTAGGDETAWVVEYSRNEDFSDALTLNVSGTPAADLTGLTAEATYYARVKAVCGEGIESEYSNAISFKPTNAMALTINRGAVQAEKVPFDGYNADYYNTVSQFIIPADSLAGLQWATFNKLTFFESGTDAKTLPNDKFEVYMAEVSDATISALADWSSLSKVMNEATLSLNGGQMEVTLSDPYLYRGGNLLIGFKQTAIGSYKRIYWLGVTAQGASFGGTSESSASQQNFLPKMKIDYVPGEEPSCYVPTGLALSNVTAQGVSASWDNEEGVAWQYAVVLASAGVPADGEYIDIAANSVVIESGLNDNADYIFYLRKNCGETDGVSQAVSASFHTPQLPASVPFADDFESGNGWLFVNGANGWIIGTDAHNGEGSTQAMYISSNGSTNTYTISSASVSYATKRFSIPAGSYIFSYDWKANGESTYDYLRVALVPDSIELPASFSYTTNLPTGWIAMDGGSKLNQSTAWATYTSAETSIAEGDYKVVFVWRNDGMYGDQAPAAIDNFAISKVLCSQPAAITISDLTATSAAVGWTAPAEQSAWQLVCSTNADVVPAEATPIDVNSNPYIISGLDSETNYYVYVRAKCGDDEYSRWSARGAFRTASTCQTPNGLKLDEVSVSAATISWNTFGQSEFNLRYKAAADADWTILNDAASPKLIESLAANTSYSVQVQAACEDADSWSTTFTFKTLCNAWSIVEDGNYVEDFEAYAGSAYNVNSAAPDCWAVAADQSVKPHVIGSGNYKYVHSGSKALTFYGSGNCYAALPQFVEALSGLQISFWMQTESATNGNLVLGYITAADQGDFATFQPIDSLDRSYNVMTNHEISLENVPAEAARLAFCWNYSGQWSCCIDDIEVSLIPTCLKPTGLAISEVAARSAKAEWVAGAEEQSAWQIALDTIAGFNPDTLSNLIDVNENPYVLDNLLPEHTYYIYVRANCAEDDKSKWSNLASFTTTVACPAPTALTATLTPGNGSIATLSWSAGAVENAWTLEYSLNADLSDPIVVLANDTFVNLSGLTAEATYYARVKANCGDLDGESLYSATISFKPTDAYELLINDGAATNGYVPVYSYWADHKSMGQFIVPAEQLVAIQWDSIKALTFYSNANHDYGDGQFEAYIAEVEETTYASNTLSDWSEMILVKAAASLVVTDKKMVVTFDEPYQYEGGNLMIGIKQTAAGTATASSSTLAWYGVYASNASVGGYQNKTTGALSISRQSFLPKMLIDYAPGVEPACKKPTGLVVSDITASSASVAWDEVEGANWEYAVAQAGEEPAEFSAAASNPLVLENLFENTQYVFYLRRACDEDGNSAVISIDFTTDILKATIPFYEGFETANSGWKLLNGEQPNAWMIGGDAAKDGAQALYISNNGADNTYTKDVQSSTFAYILLDFAKAGDYVVEYDWRAYGDYSDLEEDQRAMDYMRVALVPNVVSFAPGDPDLPAAAIALDNEGGLYFQNDWQHISKEVTMSVGLYKLVVAWFNDEYYGEDYPGAIDNISIREKGAPTSISNTGFGADGKAIKFIRDEKVFILVNGIIYDATGRKVEVVK